jgi:hypothetical protein
MTVAIAVTRVDELGPLGPAGTATWPYLARTGSPRLTVGAFSQACHVRLPSRSASSTGRRRPGLAPFGPA